MARTNKHETAIARKSAILAQERSARTSWIARLFMSENAQFDAAESHRHMVRCMDHLARCEGK